jgi:CIC family chloride channel protein
MVRHEFHRPEPGRMTRSSPRARWLVAALDRFRYREDQLALVLSLLIGALVGLVVVAFILLTGRLASYMYPSGGAGWRRLVVPILGALVSGVLLWRYFPDARGSGIPQTKAALFIYDGRISFRTVIGKFVCCCTSLASGIALGREGPSVQIGAGLSSMIARRLGLSREQVRWLIPVGSSAALAAAFNTPIAAVLFSLEEIMGDLHAPVLGSVVLSSATSWMVLHLILGDDPLFHVSAYHLVNPSEFAIYAVLGVVGGLGSVAFVKLLLRLRRWFLRLPRHTAWLQPAAGGLFVGVVGYFLPEVLGVGYDQVERVLAGDLLLRTVVLLGALKIVASAVCYASGNAGGIFGPSLFIGAMMGGAVGSVAHLLFPQSTAGPGAYALVGMGAAFAGIVRTPLTSVIMIFELTRDYTIIVPLMISNLVAFFISQKLQREPIYEALSHQQGVHLPTGETRGPAGRVRVIGAMRPKPDVLGSDVRVREALERVRASDLEAWPVVDQHGLLGMLSWRDLTDAAGEGRGEHRLLEIVPRQNGGGQPGGADHPPHVHPDHGLGTALARMGATGRTVLPVVSRANARQLLGIVTLVDLLEAFGLPQPSESRPSRV